MALTDAQRQRMDRPCLSVSLLMLVYCANILPDTLSSLPSDTEHTMYEVECRAQCSVQDRRQFYQQQHCKMLKDFKDHSHVLCSPGMNMTQEKFKIKQIDAAKLDGRRHKRAAMSRPEHMDMRDHLDPETYHRFAAIQSYIEEVSARHEFVSKVSLGQTAEGREILGLRIGESRAGAETRSVLVDGGMHAREWITVATALQIIGRLITVFKSVSESSCNNVLTSIDWYIVPVLNPDGYEYSHQTDRFWRKNRRPAPEGSNCDGVDLNRNFEVGYGLGADTNPCSEVYKGTHAHSEPETLAIVQLGTQLNTTLLYYVSLHAYGQSWLTPWGYKTGAVENMEELETVAKNAFHEIICNYGKEVPAREYEVGGAADIYYTAGGASDDWVYDKTGTRFAYTIELPDDGRQFGFLLPPQMAPQVAEDIWVALKSLALQTVARTL